MKKRTPRLGQHFLTAPWAASALVHSLALQPGETILEIGPGKGALTATLLKTGHRVIAIEKDPALVAVLREKFADEIRSGRLSILESDVRDSTPSNLGLGAYVLAANIPYYITGEIIRDFLTAPQQPRAMALLIQKEVADRIVAEKGSILSISVRIFGTPRLVKKVPRGNFSPPPSVDSAIILIESISRDRFDGVSEQDFFKVVRAGFASRRKFLSNNLAISFDRTRAAQAMQHAHVQEKARAEDLTPDQWMSIARELGNK